MTHYRLTEASLSPHLRKGREGKGRDKESGWGPSMTSGSWGSGHNRSGEKSDSAPVMDGPFGASDGGVR